MKLYYAPGACSLAVRIAIHELGIKSEFEKVDIITKRTESGKDYLKINPKGAVPALELDNGEILTENSVIQQYLADKYKATHLLPGVDDIQRYRALEWLNFVTTELHKTASPFFNPKFPTQTKEEFLKPAIKSKLKYVDQHLKDKKFLLGEKYSLADGYLFVILNWLPHFKMDLKEFPNLQRYFDELKTRKSVQQALKEEKLN